MPVATGTGTAAPAQGQGLLMPLPEVAALLGRTVDTLRRLIREGQLPAPAVGGGRHGLKQFWRRADLDLWVQLGCPDRKRFEEAQRHAAAKRKRQ
jgi:excisionase family DNA binding protein